MKHVLILALALALGLLVVGCGKKEEAAPAAPAAAAAPAGVDAKTLFDQRCASCHGTSGKGDGPAAASLTPKPRDYTDKEWQAKVTDDEIKKIIVSGGLAVGKSPIMPPQPDLQNKPAELDALVAYIRSFGK